MTALPAADSPLLNCTPHTIVIQLDDGRRVSLPPSGRVLRLSVGEETNPGGPTTVGPGIPLSTVSYTTGGDSWAELRPDCWYIVSFQFAQRHPDAPNLLVPHDLVRDDGGRVVGARSLARVARTHGYLAEADTTAMEATVGLSLDPATPGVVNVAATTTGGGGTLFPPTAIPTAAASRPRRSERP